MLLTVKAYGTIISLASVHTLAHPGMLQYFILSYQRRSRDRSDATSHSTLATHIHRLLMHLRLSCEDLFATSLPRLSNARIEPRNAHSSAVTLQPLLHTHLQHRTPLLQRLQLADHSKLNGALALTRLARLLEHIHAMLKRTCKGR
jgi:hypothetical protein